MRLTELFSHNAKPVWVPPGDFSEVAGFVIPRGMVYVGTQLRSVQGSGEEPALINPRHPVDKAQPSKTFRWSADITGYGTLSPKVKALYLGWLAGGRKSEQTSTGCLMLFLFGLERRVLHDYHVPSLKSTVQGELPSIRAELLRLLDLHGEEHRIFAEYAEKLIVFIDTLVQPKVLQRVPWETLQAPGSTLTEVLPWELKVALGQVAAAGEPIPADLAYCWYLQDPSITKREPTRVCPEVFRKVFLREYAQRFAKGMEVEGTFEKIARGYCPLSPSFGPSKFEALLDLPDISAQPELVAELQRLGYECDDKLAEYARLLAAAPEKAGSLEALVALPLDLWPEGRRYPFVKLASNLEASSCPHAISVATLLSWLPRFVGKPLQKPLALQKALARVGLVMYPEWAGSDPDTSWVSLYREPPEQGAPVPKEYELAVHAFSLLHQVILADNTCIGREHSILEVAFGFWPTLTVAQQWRLRALFSVWLVYEPDSHSSNSRALENLSAKEKARIGTFLYEVAEQAELNTLALTKTLGQIATRKLRRTRAAREPVLVHSELGSKGFAIPETPPAPVEPPKPLISLDMARVAVLQEESAEVTSMLGSIFEEETPVAVAPSLPASVESTLLGLDDAHSAFAKQLTTRQTWSRIELLELAAQHRLLLDGALERINEAAYDLHDEPLFEGEDPIEMNSTIVLEPAV